MKSFVPFKDRLIKKYGYRSYFDIDFSNINTRSNINIECSLHGKTDRMISNLLNKKSKHPCKYCSMAIINIIKNIHNKSKFIERAKKANSNKYDYSKLPSIFAGRDVVSIICPHHGEFKQQWTVHVMRDRGCPTCGRIKPKQYYTDKANKIHGIGTYSYDLLPEMVYSRNVYDFICNKHKIKFKQQMYSHYNGQGCPKCGREKLTQIIRAKIPKEEWLRRFHKHHGDRYDYSHIDEIYGRKKVKIICPEHGEFLQTAEIHSTGHGCQECGKRKNETFMVYSEKSFNLKPEMKKWDGVLYVIRAEGNNESFIKVGITKESIKKRSNEMRRLGYSIEVIHELEMKIYDAFNLEQQLLMEVDNFHHYPIKKFNGRTECLEDSHIVLEKIEKYLNV